MKSNHELSNISGSTASLFVDATHSPENSQGFINSLMLFDRPDPMSDQYLQLSDWKIDSTSNNLTHLGSSRVTPNSFNDSNTGSEATTVSLSADSANQPRPSSLPVNSSINFNSLPPISSFLFLDQYSQFTNRNIDSTSNDLTHLGSSRVTPDSFNDFDTGCESTVNTDSLNSATSNPEVSSGSQFNICEKIKTGEKCNPTKKKFYQCSICRKCCSDKVHFQEHMNIHSNDKPFECSVCGKCFRQKASIPRHMRIHTGEKPYQCDICSKSFVYSGTFNRHLKIHKNAELLQCEICNECFVGKQKFKQHLETHTKDKSFQCEICGKCFRLKLGLQCHIKIHTEDKSFQCEICRKGFRWRKNLKRHLLIHTQNRFFQ
ncbi:MAG: C2H2-type zinc finger protein [Endozoicomonadaceae bacterium]|nr:C2H2-type zinc finger protein [Endozoicomonadaceae bacterium]